MERKRKEREKREARKREEADRKKREKEAAKRGEAPPPEAAEPYPGASFELVEGTPQQRFKRIVLREVRRGGLSRFGARRGVSAPSGSVLAKTHLQQWA